MINHSCWTIKYDATLRRHKVMRVTREMERSNPEWWFECAETYCSLREATVNRKAFDSIMWEAEDYNNEYYLSM